MGSFLTFWSPNGQFFGVVVGLKNCFKSNTVGKQLLISIFSSIINFDFDLVDKKNYVHAVTRFNDLISKMMNLQYDNDYN